MTSMVSFERVFEVLDAREPIADRPGAVDLVAPTGRVEFRDVTFRYPPAAESSIASMETQAIPGADPDRDVLVGLSLTIEPGETAGARRGVGRRQEHARLAASRASTT